MTVAEEFANHPKELEGNNDLLTITRPDIIKKIHVDYLEAGADIIETNTFTSTETAQKDYLLHDKDFIYRLNVQAAKLAKEACVEVMARQPERKCYVAGAMGPTNKTCSISPKVEEPDYRDIGTHWTQGTTWR